MTKEETQVAASGTKMPRGDTTNTEGNRSTPPIIVFLFHHTNFVLTPACMTFVEAALPLKEKSPQISLR